MTATSLSTPALSPLTPILAGKHVTLEALTLSHIPSLYESIGRKRELWMCIHSGPFSSPADFTTYIHARIAAGPSNPRWSIRLNTGNASAATYIGIVGLESIDPANRAVEIGPVIYGSPLQRTRAGTEVLLLMGDLVFSQCRFRRWEWRCNALNVASRRAAERYGFVLEGVLRQHQVVRGQNRDTCVFAMLDRDWATCKRIWEVWLHESNFDTDGMMRRRGMGGVREEVRAAGEEVGT